MRRLLVLFVLAMALPAHAIISNCFPPLVTHSPSHPGASDRVDIFFAWAIAYRFGDTYYVSEPTQSGDTLSFDVLIAGETAPAGYRTLGKLGFADGDATFATFGPLPPGQYRLQVNVKQLNASGGAEPICLSGYDGFVVQAQAGPTKVGPVVEYYHAALDHYFITQNPAEMADLDHGVHAGWKRTGETFLAYLPGESDSRGNWTCRWYASPANVDSHFFSASANECIHVNTPSSGSLWHQETLNAFEVSLPDLASGECRSGTLPVYRLWNGRSDSNHRYTTSLQVKLEMIARGYVPEGYGPDAVAMCAPL